MKMMPLLLVLAVLFPHHARAAQSALVTLEQAAIRERPALDAKIIESKNAGTKIRISSFSKDGWYKVKSTTGQFGWIWQGDIAVLTHKEDMQAAGLDMREREHNRRSGRSEPWLFLKGIGFVQGLISSDVSSRLGLGAGKWFLGLGGAGELAVRTSQTTRISLRASTYSSTNTVSFQGTDYTVKFEATPVYFGIEHALSEDENFDFAVALYLGMSLPNRLTISTPFSAPNSMVLEKQYYAALAQFAGRYRVSRTIAALFEVGFHFTQIPRVTASAFNGDSPFRTDGNLSTLIVNQIGPALGAGIQLGF